MVMEFLNYKKLEKQNITEEGRIVIDSNFTKELMNAIRENKISLIMSEKDKLIAIGSDLPNSVHYNGDVFINLSDVVAVHVTPIPPTDDVIMTKESNGVMNEMLFVDPSTGIEHTVPYLVGDDTTHFTLNCVVHNHMSGNDWNSYKYGVMIDFNKLDKTKILDVKSEDTYLDGNAELNDYFLFCPLGEREQVSKINPKAIVIEYNGITLREAISYMIIFSGRKLEPYGTYGWGRNSEYGFEVEDTKKLEKLVVSEEYPVLKGQFGNALHSETKYMARRMWKREYEALISLIRYNQEHEIDMPNNIMLIIMTYGGAYGLPGTVPVSLEEYQAVVFPILEKYGYSVDESLFEDLEVDGNMKIIDYSQSYDGMPFISCPKWEEILRDRIIKIIKNNIKSHKI